MTIAEFDKRLCELRQLLEGYAITLTRNRQEAQDLFQETICRACANLDKFRRETNFRAWMCTIMKHIFINEYRRKKKWQTHLDQTADYYYLNQGQHTVRNQADSDMMLEELTQIIASLPIHLRQPFELHYLGYKYHEIAACMELPLGTVKSRIFFARKALQKAILKRFGKRPLSAA